MIKHLSDNVIINSEETMNFEFRISSNDGLRDLTVEVLVFREGLNCSGTLDVIH